MRTEISIVIPTQDMSEHLELLLQRLISSGVLELTQEVIVVNDASKDNSIAVGANFLRDQNYTKRLRWINNPEVQGRFLARHQGVLAAQGKFVLFLDTRALPQMDAGLQLSRLLEKHSFLMGMIEINTNKSIFNLYWQRSHQFVFRRHFQDVKNGFYLTKENYEQYAKGTGALLFPRDIYLKATASVAMEKIEADDTILIRELVKFQAFYVSQDFSVDWEPRQTWIPFLQRLYDRGPGFVEYHFFTQRTKFFYLSLASLLMAAGMFLVSWRLEQSLIPGLLALLLLAALSGVLLAKSVGEFFRLLPLHLLVLLSFSAGVIHGLIHWFFQRSEKREIL